jgi:hypothetical protein
MKLADERERENVDRPGDTKAVQKKAALKEGQGIIHGDSKKAGEAVIQSNRQR